MCVDVYPWCDTGTTVVHDRSSASAERSICIVLVRAECKAVKKKAPEVVTALAVL